MQPRKLKIGIGRFPYAGNGSTASEIPEIGDFLFCLGRTLLRDPRVEETVWTAKKVDTPIPMCRNAMCLAAKQAGVDCLLMIDSDNAPDVEIGHDIHAKPFWKTAFDLFCRHYDRGPCVIAAPYVGPPPDFRYGGLAVPYVFRWATKSNDPGKRGITLELFSREEAAQRSGIEAVAAIGTGVMLLDTRVLDTVPPAWFDYDRDGPYWTRKSSTEDVYFTRNCNLYGIPVYCLWDCWAGHAKPSMEGRPRVLTSDQVAQEYADAVLRGQKATERLIDFRAGEDEPPDVLEEIPPELSTASALQGAVPVSRDPDGVVSVGFRSDPVDHEILEQLVRAVADGHPDRPIEMVEVGSWVGQGTLAMLRGLGNAGGRVHCVDTWQGSPSDRTEEFAKHIGSQHLFETFARNIGSKRLGTIVLPWRATSAEAARQFDSKADLIYIDATHTYADVRNDLHAWTPHVKPGGVLCGHDYRDDGFPGVTRAVDEFAAGRNLEVQSQHHTWWVTIPQNTPEPCREPTRQTAD